MTCARWFEPLSAAVDGELDEPALARLDQHCAGCPSCRSSRRRLEDLRRRSLVRVPHEAPALSAAILHRSTADRRRRRAAGRAVAVLGVAAVLLGTLAVVGRPDVDDSTPTAGRVAGPPVTITVVDDAFERARPTIEPGTTIEWANDGRHTHRLVRRLGGALTASDLEPGRTESVRFDEPGEYEYYCSIHDGMAGRVLVRS